MPRHHPGTAVLVGWWGRKHKLLFKKKALCSGLLDLMVPSALHFLPSLLVDRRSDNLFTWFRLPVKNFFRVFWKCYRFKIIVVSITLIVALMLFNFMYSTPVSDNHGDRNKGTGCSWDD